MNGRLLLVNAGNTHTVTAVFASRRLRTIRSRPTRDETAAQARARIAEAEQGGKIRALVLAAVVPQAARCWQEAAHTRDLPLVRIDGNWNPGIPVDYPRRASLGADRIANICAAVARFGAPVIAADFGTAATFDVVHPDRGFVGGVIAPGPGMLREALADRTALLPRLVASRGAIPALGRSTEGAMRIGVRIGYAGLVRSILEHLCTQPGLAEARICFTGGAARDVRRDLGERFPVVPHLTLEGLARLYSLRGS